MRSVIKQFYYGILSSIQITPILNVKWPESEDMNSGRCSQDVTNSTGPSVNIVRIKCFVLK